MGELHRSGKTVLHLQPVKGTEAPKDELLDAVKQMAAGDYEVFGEIGRGHDSTVVYLANDIAASRLVALKLTPSRLDSDEYILDVVRELDSTLPSFENACSRCGTPLRQWGRFCSKCGMDLYSIADQKWTADELREAVQEFATDRFDILGEMRTQGGGRIYFARDVASGRVEALRLQKTREDEFSLGFTGVLKPLVASVVGRDRPSLLGVAQPPIIDQLPSASAKQPQSPTRQPPTPARPASPPEGPRQPPPVAGLTQPARRSGARYPPPAQQDPWAPLREFIQQPVVMVTLLACLVLVLLILLAVVE
ncbi:MAG: hypothetical protein AMJ65_17020 [Phycisphaerae bacterium SG8_4]|nr:MAG: hypothetical protein AMJ65_17020 [Phycisphaerae bacterium SG8_4]